MVNKRQREYYRGDIWFVNGTKNVTGSEPAGYHPAIIVSNDVGNAHSPNVEVVYLTSKRKKHLPTHVYVMCDRPSIALCENVQTVAKARLDRFVRSCSGGEMRAVDRALICSLGLKTASYRRKSAATVEFRGRINNW